MTEDEKRQFVTNALDSTVGTRPAAGTALARRVTSDTRLPANIDPLVVMLGTITNKHTARAMRVSLDACARLINPAWGAEDVPWHQLDYQTVARFKVLLASQYKLATVNRHLSALRKIAKEAWKLGHLSHEAHAKIASVEDLKGSRLAPGREVHKDEIDALFKVAHEKQPKNLALRDAAILAVAITCGLRRSELAGLHMGNYDPVAGKIQIIGKGNKEREIAVGDDCRRFLGNWLAVRGYSPGPLFLRINMQTGFPTPEGISPERIYNMLTELAKKSEAVTKLSPHDFRRTFISQLLDRGNDIATVAAMAGHSSVTTTQRYDRRGWATKQRAALSLNGLLPMPKSDQSKWANIAASFNKGAAADEPPAKTDEELDFAAGMEASAEDEDFAAGRDE